MIEHEHYVYEWYIKETKEIFYVGKGSKNRVTSMKDRNKYFKDIRNKYDCDYRILKYFEKENDAYDYELEYGTYLKSIGQARACYMLGNVNRYIDFEVTKKTKKTQFKKGHRTWSTGLKMSDEFREKCRQRMLGTKQSEETKRKRSNSLKGHKVSQKTIDSLKQRIQKKVYVIDVNTNEIINTFISAKECSIYFNVSLATISNKCSKNSIWRGYRFTYQAS